MKQTPPNRPEAWLERAWSDIALAEAGFGAKGVRNEDVCYHAQQGAEKAIKAVLIHEGIDFPWTHSVERLIQLCVKGGVPIPWSYEVGAELSDYATLTRYPGDYEPITPVEVQGAIDRAKEILDWASAIVRNE